MSTSIIGIKTVSDANTAFVSLELGYITIFFGFCYTMFLLAQYVYKTFQEHQMRCVAAKIAARKPDFDVHAFFKSICQLSGEFKDIFGMLSGHPQASAPKPVSKPAAKGANPFEALFGEGGLDAIMKEVTVGLNGGLNEKPVGKKPAEKKEESAEEKPSEKKEEQVVKEEPAQKPAQKPVRKLDEKVEGAGNVVVKNIIEIMPHADLASDSDRSTDESTDEEK